MRASWLAMTVTIGVLTTAGCSAQARTPEPVPLDHAECARCRMLISTEAGAGEILSSREDTRFYDDIGCLAADWGRRGDRDSVAYVKLAAGGWREARSAWFAQPAAARTPMGSGFVAFATPSEARAVDGQGRALAWNDVVLNAGARP